MNPYIRFIQLCIIIIYAPVATLSQTTQKYDSIYVASWNVENLFDTRKDSVKNDSEFLPGSEKQWNEEKFEKKLTNMQFVINYMNNGCGPDLIGFQEVENINVLKRLLYKFRDRDYVVAHRESPDERGIDVALMFDRNVLSVVTVDTIKVTLPSNYPTRYILHVALNHKISSTKLHVFVNHWPSRRGGEVKSEPNREAAAKALRKVVDSLFTKKNDNHIIIMGDFNDEPSNVSIKEVLRAEEYLCKKVKPGKNKLLNLSYERFLAGEGSYLFGADWNMLDQIIISSSLSKNYQCGSFEVIKPSFMITKEGNRKGAPLPTFSGNKYLGGYSDHFPVGAKFIFMKGK